MFLATINKSKQLLQLCSIGQVTLKELAKGREELGPLLEDLSPGFSMLSDLGRLDSIDVNCASEIANIMELCDQKGVGMVVRVIPAKTKDIGMNILSILHYHHHQRIITCESMVEAAKLLSL